MRRLALWLVLLAACGTSSAHNGSTAYLQAEIRANSLTLRADYALRDLDDTLGVDANDDGALSWGELQAASPRLLAALQPHWQLQADGQPCEWAPEPQLQVAEHADGPYAVWTLQSRCSVASPGEWRLGVSALFEFDAGHRALLRWQQAGREDSAVFTPERHEVTLSAARGWRTTLMEYLHEGLAHVWSGWDHMLFIAGLFLPAALRRRTAAARWQPTERLGPTLRDAAVLVTAFTIAHAVTLCLTVLGWVSLPSRFVESLVALSVLFTGLNNLLPMVGRRGLFALAWLFGLIHGTAIAGALLDLGLPSSGRLIALLGFNIGVESAQLLLVAVLVPIAFALRHWRGYERLVLWPGSLLVAVAGLVWFIDRAFAMDWPLPI